MIEVVAARNRARIIRELADQPRWPISEKHGREFAPYHDQFALNSIRGLADLLDTLPKLGRVAEIGCYAGVSTECLALYCESLLAVDPWEGTDDIFEQFQERLRPYPHVRVIRERSPGAARHVEDGSLDLVYVDGMHTRAEVEADIAAWLPKVRVGGWMAGHDFVDYGDSWMSNWIQVVPAVRAILGEPDAVFSDSSWLKRL